VHDWPPHLPPPDLWAGTLNTGILLVSVFPNYWVQKVAERQDLPKVQIGLVPIRITHFWYTPVHDTYKSKETATAPGGGE
jgi:heme/copper-type cytochrome/quinol oxidase subunit 3